MLQLPWLCPEGDAGGVSGAFLTIQPTFTCSKGRFSRTVVPTDPFHVALVTSRFSCCAQGGGHQLSRSAAR